MWVSHNKTFRKYNLFLVELTDFDIESNEKKIIMNLPLFIQSSNNIGYYFIKIIKPSYCMQGEGLQC